MSSWKGAKIVGGSLCHVLLKKWPSGCPDTPSGKPLLLIYRSIPAPCGRVWVKKNEEKTIFKNFNRQCSLENQWFPHISSFFNGKRFLLKKRLLFYCSFPWYGGDPSPKKRENSHLHQLGEQNPAALFPLILFCLSRLYLLQWWDFVYVGGTTANRNVMHNTHSTIKWLFEKPLQMTRFTKTRKNWGF